MGKDTLKIGLENIYNHKLVNISWGKGYARKGDKELARFVNISLGSLAEVEYLLDFTRRLGYLNSEDYTKIENLRAEVGKLLWNFYKKVAP